MLKFWYPSSRRSSRYLLVDLRRVTPLSGPLNPHSRVGPRRLLFVHRDPFSGKDTLEVEGVGIFTLRHPLPVPETVDPVRYLTGVGPGDRRVRPC